MVQTMPPGGPGDPAYAKHANALRAFCSQPPPDGEVVPVDRPDEDEGYISPPIIIEPLYSCVTAIEVRGLIYGAKLEVFIDGSSAASVQVTRPSQELVQVPALSVGQILTATQEKDGIISAMSAPVEARDHKVDFPDGMPKPRIDPTLIHECGRVIAVRHPRGADVTVFVNGGDPRTFTSGGDWTNVAPAIRPFILGDAYSARATMCSDDSPLSDAEVAVAPPNPMPTPGLDPATVYAGQELVDLNNLPNGSLTTVEISGAGAAQQFSTAVSWQPEVDVAGPNGGPLAAGQIWRLQRSSVSRSRSNSPTPSPATIFRPPSSPSPLSVTPASMSYSRCRVQESWFSMRPSMSSATAPAWWWRSIA